MKTAYFDCPCGAGGDMLVAAMADAGVDADLLRSQAATLPIEGLTLEFSETLRGGLRALSFEPTAPHQHNHRRLDEILEIIRASAIAETAKDTATSIFNKLAEAEAKVHGKQPSQISFHEVGAVDSIADIVCASVALDQLRQMGVRHIRCSALSLGGGAVKCAHGILPVPTPATVELVRGVPVVGGPVERELLTPTAAAILVSVVDEFGPLPAMKIESIGCGAGSAEIDGYSNIVRLILGETLEQSQTNADSVCILQTNIDDATAEVIGATTEKLLAAGALDVFTTPIYMKHNRPAVMLSVICKTQETQNFERTLFEQGLTFGVRKQIAQRSKLARDFVTVSTRFGEIRIKTGLLDGKVVTAKPEFSDCADAAANHNVPVKSVLDAALHAFRNKPG